MGDCDCRTEEGQVELLHLFHVWENWYAESNNFGDKRGSKDKMCTAEGKKLISFCVINNFKILNGKSGSDKKEEFYFY
jgi:hypothetical protein